MDLSSKVRVVSGLYEAPGVWLVMGGDFYLPGTCCLVRWFGGKREKQQVLAN
jgi:hypothetical protein